MQLKNCGGLKRDGGRGVGGGWVYLLLLILGIAAAVLVDSFISSFQSRPFSLLMPVCVQGPNMGLTCNVTI